MEILRFKKTIGILSIVLGALRFLSIISTYQDVNALAISLDSLTIEDALINDIHSYTSTMKFLLPVEFIATGAILVLGIVLLCIDKGISQEMPRHKSCIIVLSILGTSLFYLILEIIALSSIPSGLNELISPLSIIFSLGFICVLIIFCRVGLKNKSNPKQTKLQPSAITNETELTLQDIEIANLKKEIEKRKLEKELLQINEDKQKEIEKLKKELAGLE